MKNKNYILPLFILITTILTVVSFYLLLNNLDSDILVNATSNNNVVLNNLSDITARDNTTISNDSTASGNSTIQVESLDTKTKVILGVGGAIIGIFLLYYGYIKFSEIEYRYSTNANINTRTPESIEMSSGMPTFNNNNN